MNVLARRLRRKRPHPDALLDISAQSRPSAAGAVVCRGDRTGLLRTGLLLRAGLITTVSMALVAGSLSEPPRAEAAPAAPLVAETDPGAPGFKPGPAPTFVPGTAINRAVVGGASRGAWGKSSSQGAASAQRSAQGAPSAQAQAQGVTPSTQIKKPGLGTQDFYPLERRAIGDRMELLVNLANGNVVVRNKDLAFAGTGLNTAVNHFYNNMADNTGAFGQRWTMSTGRDVGLDLSDPNKVVLQGPSGYRQDYNSDGGGGYRSPSGANAKLTKNQNGYELKFDKTKEKWNFDNNGFFTTQVDRNDNTITYNYNADGTLASIRDTRGAVTTFEYDSAGRVTKMTDPTGYQYSGYTYDLQGQHTGFTGPDGKRVSYGYDTNGNLTSITDPNGNQYRLEYDDQRRVTKVDEPRETGVLSGDRAVSSFAYTSDTETKETAPNGGVTTYTFDDDGRQTKAKDPLGREQSKTYTANSEVNATTSIGGNVSTASFDPNNNLIGTQLPTGARGAVGYADAANPNAPTSMTDSEGRQTTMTYDSKGNPLTVKQAQTGQGITRTYNPNGTVKDSTDGRGNKTSYAYDGDGRLITVTFPSPRRPMRYTYDARSRLDTVTDGNGVVLDYDYDAADRVVQLSQKTGSTSRVIQRSDFDANGNKTANYFGSTTKQFAYSPRNQVVSDVRRGGTLVPTDTVNYTYDATNNIASLKDAGGTTSYRYNQANDLTELTDFAGGVTRYTYDNDGNQTVTAFPNGQNSTRVYDKSGRETRRTNTSQGNSAVHTYSYAGANGDTELLQTEGQANATTTRYTYDGSGRLTRARNTNNSGGAVRTDYIYGYDRSSNLTGFQGKTQTFNNANALTGIDNTAAGADNQGNFTSASGTSVNYTPTNQQNTKVTPDLTFTTNYDSADTTQPNKITDQVSGGQQFNYEFTQTALGMTGRVRGGQGRYSISRDPDGNPVMQRNPDGTRRYFQLDHQGSVLGTTRADGTLGAAFHYKPYGDWDVRTGPDSSLADNFIGFQGGFFHSEPRNTQFGHRWYSATIGQFTQPDPIGTPGSSGSGQDNRNGIGGPYSDDGNSYNFANSSPCNNTDVGGLAPDPACNVGRNLYYGIGPSAAVVGSIALGRIGAAGAAQNLLRASGAGGLATYSFAGKFQESARYFDRCPSPPSTSTRPRRIGG